MIGEYVGGPLLLRSEKPVEEFSALKARISKSDPIDIAIKMITNYAIKQWGKEEAKNVVEQLNKLGQEVKHCRDKKVGTETPWNFGDPGLARKVATTLNTFMKPYKLKATQDGTEVKIAYFGQPPTKRIEMEG